MSHNQASRAMTKDGQELAMLHWPGPLVPAGQHTRLPTLGVAETQGRHPRWCTQGHRCTATRLPEGEHVSIPEMWETSLGKVIGTRYRSRDGRRDWIEVRANLRLDPTSEALAHQQARVAVLAVYLTLTGLTESV